MESKKINFTTSDGIKLAANEFNPSAERAVILLHQMRMDKSSYDFFIDRLVEEGYRVLALDFRGFGESQGDLSKFTESDFQGMFNDVMAAEEYLRQNNQNLHIQIIGSSIGANTALRFQEMNTVSSVVLLSPGRNYHGIDPTDSNLSNIACPIFYLNSEEDASVQDTQALYNESPLTNDLKKIQIVSGNAHGVNLLHDVQVAEAVIDWLNKH